MPNYLIIPTQIDMLYVPKGEYSVLDQKADFTILPYVDKEGYDTNSNTANLSEMILSQPFENANLRLGKGVHLHWALPDSLTRGEESDEGTTFPEVPNRWLVTRKRAGKIEKQWVVESDYLYPEGINKEGSAVSVPYGKGTQPYRYMGRSMPLNIWKEREEEFYRPLTALGYGEAAFAAFYPNCFSVFGFYDQELDDLSPDLEYDLIGWYSDTSSDPLVQFLSKQKNKTPEDAKKAVLEEFDWKIPGEEIAIDGMLCFANLKVDPDFDPTFRTAPVSPTITVANTPAEALSAHLANKFSQDLSGAEKEQSLQRIENQLEAVQAATPLNDKQLDLTSRFREIRHENCFTAGSQDFYWSVSMENLHPVTEKTAPTPLSLPIDLEELLERINNSQEEYNQNLRQIESIQQQLFADWYKYMITLYPSDRFDEDTFFADQIKTFIEEREIKPLQALIRQTGILSVSEDNSGIFSGLSAGQSESGSIASQIAQAVNQLIGLVNSKNNDPASEIRYLVQRSSGPRFWEPNEPVILIEGEGVNKTERHGEDGELEGVLFKSEVDLFSDEFVTLSQFLQSLPAGFGENSFKQQPWYPFLLEWEAHFFPLENLSNLDGDNNDYHPDFLRHNYDAPVTSHDLELKQGAGRIVQKASIYTGDSILTDQTTTMLEKQIESHWKKQGLIAAYEAATGKQLSLPADLDHFATWYETVEERQPGIELQIQAYREIKQATCLSQALSGFNNALLSCKQTMELTTHDPLAFGEDGVRVSYQEFTDKLIREVLGESPITAPSPLNDFHPIRAGALKLAHLRLVDTFGQVKTLNCDAISTSYKMRTPGSRYLIKLPPRISQPARLDFHYLTANADAERVSNTKNKGLICGWLLTNKLDKSLMVYNDKGEALGYFKANRWYEAIDSEQAKSIESIENPHLKRVVSFIMRAIDEDKNRDSGDIDQHFLSQYINTIDDALENIHPELSTEQQGISLLLGRPVAVVRASIKLELQGQPAINQQWNAFYQDLRLNQRTTDGFTKVKIPVRLGEYGQLNDGLIGYWLEEKDITSTTVFTPDLFFSPQSDYIDTERIESQFDSPDKEDGPINFFLSFDDSAQYVTLLMDPRGSLHATVGLLPNKEITIPDHHYRNLMENLEITFLNAPVLTNLNAINLPLSKEQDYAWSWVERDRSSGSEQWSELFSYGEITKNEFLKTWAEYRFSLSGEQVWEYLIDESVAWLEITNPEQQKAKVLAKNRRKTETLTGQFTGLDEIIEELLDLKAEHIESAELEARFGNKKEIKEGWLKLRITKNN